MAETLYGKRLHLSSAIPITDPSRCPWRLRQIVPLCIKCSFSTESETISAELRDGEKIPHFFVSNVSYVIDFTNVNIPGACAKTGGALLNVSCATAHRRTAGRDLQAWRFYSTAGAHYLALGACGMITTAAFVALDRKLARVCFALLRNGIDFNPEVRAMAGPQTWNLVTSRVISVPL